ncbi:MAG TPA: hypothetical protein VG734_15885 [Lacunisphaera sp.]|nr:hypothetical protein [Lacunisphaera sp.]
MSLPFRRFVGALALVLGGCAAVQTPLGPAGAARAIVEEYIHNGDAKTAGPLTRKNAVADLDELSDADRTEAESLMEQGALGFSVFVPDLSQHIHTSQGPIQGMIKLDRIVFVRDNKVVADFKAR